MKTATYAIETTLLAVLLTCSSCNNTSGNKKESPAASKAPAKVNIQTRPLPCNDEFIQITSIGSVNIVYTQGDYKIEATGDSALIDMVTLTFDSGILTVGMNGEQLPEIPTPTLNSVTLNISSPELKYLSICSNGGFRSTGTIETQNFIAGNLGSGEMVLDSIVCERFKYENNHGGSTTINYVGCDNAIYSAFGTSSNNITLNASESVDILSRANSTIEANVKADEVIITSNNDSKGTYTLQGKSVKAITTDFAEITLNGTTKTRNIKNSIGSKITDNLTKR